MTPTAIDDKVEEGSIDNQKEISDKIVYCEIITGDKPTKPKQIYEKPVRRISLNRELMKISIFGLILLSFWGGLTYLLLREPKNPNAISVGQYIQMKKKEKESINKGWQRTLNEVNYITNSKRGYEFIGGVNINHSLYGIINEESRKKKIDPNFKYDQLKFFNPKDKVFKH